MFVVREIKTAVGVRLIERAKMHRGGSSWSQQCPSSKPYRFGLPLTGTKILKSFVLVSAYVKESAYGRLAW